MPPEFTWTADFEATESSEPRVRRTQFGDGYEQRAGFGLNRDPKSWDLEFKFRSDAEAADIAEFLEDRGGIEPFDWTTPRDKTGKFVCRAWQYTLRACNFNNIRARFEQVFEP